jgi:hypothetical protein
VKEPSKSRAVKVETPDGVVATNLPERLPVVSEEVAILRAFLAQEIDAILLSAPAAHSTQSSNASASDDHQTADHLSAAVAKDGSAPAGAQPCR